MAEIFGRLAALILSGVILGQEEKGPPPPPTPPKEEKAADGGRLEEVLRALDGKQKGLRDLEAAFEQRQESHLLAEPDVSKGKVIYREGRLRMEWTEPKRVVLIVDKNGIVQYFPEERRAERMEAKTAMDVGSLFPGFGQPADEMRKTYEIRLLPEEKGKKEWTLELVPRRERMRRLMEKITLRIDPVEGVPVGLRIDDPNGKDRTEIELTDRKVNRGIPEERLALDLPEGTKIVTVKGGLPF